MGRVWGMCARIWWGRLTRSIFCLVSLVPRLAFMACFFLCFKDGKAVLAFWGLLEDG